jgi:hypothetical protein
MTAGREVAFERMLGRLVVDEDGRRVGRLEEAHAEWRDGEMVVTEWVLGAGGLLQRVGLSALIGTLVGRRAWREPQVVHWDDLDISDPERPRLRRRRPVGSASA